MNLHFSLLKEEGIHIFNTFILALCGNKLLDFSPIAGEYTFPPNCTHGRSTEVFPL